MTNLSPSPSPLRPSNPIVRRKYTDEQLRIAKELALSDGVAFSSATSGVAPSTIYKLLKPAAAIARKSTTSKPKLVPPEKAMMAMPIFKKAVLLGELWAANSAPSPKRDAFYRAAAKFNLDVKVFWRAYKLSLYTK
jgi:hypothetical protein